jgi:hypothetical protein
VAHGAKARDVIEYLCEDVAQSRRSAAAQKLYVFSVIPVSR